MRAARRPGRRAPPRPTPRCPPTEAPTPSRPRPCRATPSPAEPLIASAGLAGPPRRRPAPRVVPRVERATQEPPRRRGVGELPAGRVQATCWPMRPSAPTFSGPGLEADAAARPDLALVGAHDRDRAVGAQRDQRLRSPPPSRTDSTVSAPSPPPRRRSDSVHGASPAAAASDARQTSPPTMQMPGAHRARDLARPTPTAPPPAPAAASTAATTASTPDVLERALAGGGMSGGGETRPIGGRAKVRPPGVQALVAAGRSAP